MNMNGTAHIEPVMFSYDMLLKKVDTSDWKDKHNLAITPTDPGVNLLMRPLAISDYDRGFLKLLTQLTTVGEVSREEFKERFESMRNCANSFYVTVIEDTQTGKIIGTATLVLEQKFIHKCALRGRIEDVVVNNQYRGRQLGKLLLATLTELGKARGCYKMSLECRDAVMPFYEQFGYFKDEGNNYMVQRFKD